MTKQYLYYHPRLDMIWLIEDRGTTYAVGYCDELNFFKGGATGQIIDRPTLKRRFVRIGVL